jgi:hypothetical protein
VKRNIGNGSMHWAVIVLLGLLLYKPKALASVTRSERVRQVTVSRAVGVTPPSPSVDGSEKNPNAPFIFHSEKE